MPNGFIARFVDTVLVPFPIPASIFAENLDTAVVVILAGEFNEAGTATSGGAPLSLNGGVPTIAV